MKVSAIVMIAAALLLSACQLTGRPPLVAAETLTRREACARLEAAQKEFATVKNSSLPGVYGVSRIDARAKVEHWQQYCLPEHMQAYQAEQRATR